MLYKISKFSSVKQSNKVSRALKCNGKENNVNSLTTMTSPKIELRLVGMVALANVSWQNCGSSLDGVSLLL